MLSEWCQKSVLQDTCMSVRESAGSIRDMSPGSSAQQIWDLACSNCAHPLLTSAADSLIEELRLGGLEA